MLPASQQPPDRPPTPRYCQAMELDADAGPAAEPGPESVSESGSSSGSDGSDDDDDDDDDTPRASRAASREPPDAARASHAAAAPAEQALGRLPGRADPILFPPWTHDAGADADVDTDTDTADADDALAGPPDPAYAHSPCSPPSPLAYDDVSILNRRQLIARVHSLRRDLRRALGENRRLEERRLKILDENSRLATRLAELQQRRDDQRTKAIDGDFCPPTATPSSAHHQQ